MISVGLFLSLFLVTTSLGNGQDASYFPITPSDFWSYKLVHNVDGITYNYPIKIDSVKQIDTGRIERLIHDSRFGLRTLDTCQLSNHFECTIDRVPNPDHINYDLSEFATHDSIIPFYYAGKEFLKCVNYFTNAGRGNYLFKVMEKGVGVIYWKRGQGGGSSNTSDTWTLTNYNGTPYDSASTDSVLNYSYSLSLESKKTRKQKLGLHLKIGCDILGRYSEGGNSGFEGWVDGIRIFKQ